MTIISHLQNKKNTFSSLPDDCVEHLLSYLPITEIPVFKKTGRYFYYQPLYNLSYKLVYHEGAHNCRSREELSTAIKTMEELHKTHCYFSSIEIGLFSSPLHAINPINFDLAISALSKFKLEKLKLEGESIKLTDAQFKKVTEIQTLEDITINAVYDITDEVFKCSKQSKIKRMIIKNINNLTVTVFDYLKDMPNLEELTLYDCNLKEFSLSPDLNSTKCTGDSQLRWIGEKLPKLKKFNNEYLNQYRKTIEIILPLDADEEQFSLTPLTTQSKTTSPSALVTSEVVPPPTPITSLPVATPTANIPENVTMQEPIVLAPTFTPNGNEQSSKVVLTPSSPAQKVTPITSLPVVTPDANPPTSSWIVACMRGIFEVLYNFFMRCILFLRNLCP